MVFVGSALLAGIFELGFVQAIVAWIATVATAFFVYLTTMMTKRLALALVAITVILSLALAFFLAIKAMIYSITVMTPDYIQNGINCIIPSNLVPCLSLVLGARIARQVYQFKVSFVHHMTGAL